MGTQHQTLSFLQTIIFDDFQWYLSLNSQSNCLCSEVCMLTQKSTLLSFFFSFLKANKLTNQQKLDGGLIQGVNVT